MSGDSSETNPPSLIEAEIADIGCSCWQNCPAYARYLQDKDGEVAEIKERNSGHTRLALVATASFLFAWYMAAEIYCGATGYNFHVASETKFILYSFIVAAIGGESAVQAYGVWRKFK